MNRILSVFRGVTLATAVALSASACGGGGSKAADAEDVGASTPSAPQPSGPGGVQRFPQLAALIERQYSSTPEIKKAAQGYADATVSKWEAASATGKYNEALALRAASAQMCLAARADLIGKPLTELDVAELLGTLMTTRDLFSAMYTADSLQSGNPLVVPILETEACAQGGVL